MAHACMKVSPRHNRRLIQHWEVAGSVEEQNWWGQLAITWEVWGYLVVVHRKWHRHLSIQVKKCVETSNNRSGGPTSWRDNYYSILVCIGTLVQVLGGCYSGFSSPCTPAPCCSTGPELQHWGQPSMKGHVIAEYWHVVVDKADGTSLF